ncbi:hypothetical protein QTG54_000591 [Skeletonema marinoi]|uniref:N-acetyltransferase domain-containing protein n=1 Tax=Skeletonema marinoi TaxID=267567 RepID=A0AAD8YME9_9STRA|nr:hypothetical protein QTG54_000591 [Skeletonema marinoi]
MSSLLVIVALIGTLSIRATEALSSPLHHPYSKQPCFAASKQPCFAAYRCHSLSFGRASLIPLEAVSERARTDEQISQNDDGDTATTSDKPGSLNTSIGQPHSLTVVAGHGTQISSKEEVAEQELWDEILSGDEALDHLDSLQNVIRNEQQETADDQTESNQNHVEDGNTESNVEESESHSSDESEDAAASDIRASLARSAILRRAGVAGGKTKQSSRSNGRSSLARSHVNKNRRGGNEGRAIGQVLSTVRTAAAGSAGRKKLFNNEAEKKDGRTGNNSDLEARATLTVNGSVASTNKWNAAIQSAVSEVLAQPTADELQPPPGTTSMGLLGEVLHETIPVIPPLPGKVLAQRQARLDTAPISIRSSIPHSSDDTHIANLRLSVFSNFDAEKQRAFRHRSVEVINIRRRRGAVVLVAEIPTEEGENHNYLNAMEARIASGHTFGEKRTEPHPGNGAKIRSASSTIAVADGTNIATIPKQQHQQYTSSFSNKMIIGSVECSHHEFRGTMLGNSRPKGALMYVTEVAVRPDRRRCGAGAALMKGVDEVAALRNVETIYLHVDVRNKAACAMYERIGYHHLDKREPLYAQFTASLNLHDGAMHGRKHHLMCKHVNDKTKWL